jgi:hypothetical protein
MLPSEDDIANFIAFAPDAGEGKAFVFLEVRHSDSLGRPEYRLTDVRLEGGGYHK